MQEEKVPTLSRQKYVDGQIMFILETLKAHEKRLESIEKQGR